MLSNTSSQACEWVAAAALDSARNCRRATSSLSSSRAVGEEEFVVDPGACFQKMLFVVSTMKYIYILVTALTYILHCFHWITLFFFYFFFGKHMFSENVVFGLYHEIYL